jgi:hypothetical protein
MELRAHLRLALPAGLAGHIVLPASARTTTTG